MKTTKEERIALSIVLECDCIWSNEQFDEVSSDLFWKLLDDANTAERLEAENAKLSERLKAFEDCVKRLYAEALD